MKGPGRTVAVEALDGEGRRLARLPVEVVLADRHRQRAVGEGYAVRLVAVAAEEDLEVVTRAQPELVRAELGDRARSLHVHEIAPDGEDEVVARVHPADDPVPQRRVHPGVPVHVVGVRPTPLQDEVVLALERRRPRVLVADRPRQPAGRLQRDVAEAFDVVGVGGRERRRGDRPPELVEAGEEPLPVREVVAHRAASSGTEKCRW